MTSNNISKVIYKQDVTGLILCGGQGLRMGGVEKALLPWGEQRLIDAMYRCLAPQVNSVVISANRQLDDYAQLGLPIVTDAITELTPNAGPLLGLLAGLKVCRTPYLACVPCDTPLLPVDVIVRLTQRLQQSPALLAFATSPDMQGDLREHPTVCVLHHSLQHHLYNYLKGGNRKMLSWMRSQTFTTVYFDQAPSFKNMNKPEDLQPIATPKQQF